MLIIHNAWREQYKSYICVLCSCVSINYAVLHCCSGDLLGHSYTSCGSIGQLVLLTLHLLSHFIRGSTAGSK